MLHCCALSYSAVEHAIAVEQARITEARNQLESLKGELANAKADVTKTIEAATEELRRCYKIEYNEGAYRWRSHVSCKWSFIGQIKPTYSSPRSLLLPDELKRKLDKATSALTLLKHQAYLLKSNALRLNADAQDEKAVRNDLTAQRDELVGKRAALAEEALALDKQFLLSAMDEAARERMWALQRHLADLDAATLDNEGIVRLASLCASDDAAVSPLLEVLSAIKTTTKDALAALAINKGAAFGDGSLTQTASAVLCSATVPLIPAPGEETGAGGSVSCGEAVYESIRSICDGASTDVQGASPQRQCSIL